MPRLPLNNQGAALGGVLVAVALAVAQSFLKFLESGQPFPETGEGWLRLVLPAVLGGLLAAQTPRYSAHEAATGHRHTDSPPDAPTHPVGLDDGT